jgi:hypothetical protein
MTMNFDAINEYYRQNPPETILDCEGVKHINEVPLPATYELNPCSCGKVHALDSDTWYHSAVENSPGHVAVYRACKICRIVLTMGLVKK